MCDCIKEMNDLLKDRNGVLVTTLFGTSKCCLWVDREKTGRGTKKPPAVIASYCPMCGEKYPLTDPQRSQGATDASQSPGRNS